VTTRPIKPKPAPVEEPATANRDTANPEAQAPKGKKSGREGGPIFLRRRWLASDGGA